MCTPNHCVLKYNVMFVLLSFNVLYTLITALLELEIELKHIHYSIILLRK